jgi:hypothetical protein
MSGNGDLTTDSLNILQNGNENIVDNIKQLQQFERDLYTELQNISASPGNNDKQNELISKINTLAGVRTDLFETLKHMANSTQNMIATTRVDLVDNLTLIGVIEDELNKTKGLMNQSENIKNNQIRMVEINTYYEKQYRAYTDLMKIVIKMCIPVLLLILLKKKNLVPTNIIMALILIIFVIGGYFFIRNFVDIYKRDNMDFDQYSSNLNIKPTHHMDSTYNPDNANKDADKLFDRLENEVKNLTHGCIDSGCCSDNMKYDKALRKCVDNNISLIPLSPITNIPVEVPVPNTVTTTTTTPPTTMGNGGNSDWSVEPFTTRGASYKDSFSLVSTKKKKSTVKPYLGKNYN